MKTFNLDLCNQFMNYPLSCLDVKACYWTNAYKLGFISERLYKRGVFFKNLDLDIAVELGFIGKRNYKKAKEQGLSYTQAYEHGLVSKKKYEISINDVKQNLVLASGNLMKSIHIYEYDENGEEIKNYPDNEYKEIYAPFYYAIVNRTFEFMQEINKLDGFFMFLTDCVYFRCSKEYTKEYLAIFEKYGYDYSFFTSSIYKIDDKYIYYYDDADFLNPDKKTSYHKIDNID